MNTKQPEPSATQESGTSTGTVSRALQLLTVVADAGGAVTVKYVAETMRLPTSTAHRLLQLLRTEGFVEASAEGRQYVIGRQFYRVAARVAASVPIVDLVQPVLEEIAREHDEAVLLGMYLPAQQSMTFAARADGAQKLKYEIDMQVPMPLVWGASGKAILAQLPADVVQAVLRATGNSISGATPPPAVELEKELQWVRDHGYAISEGQKLADARGIAAPIFGPHGVVGCICMTSPKSRPLRSSVDVIGEAIAQRALEISRGLGANLSKA